VRTPPWLITFVDVGEYEYLPSHLITQGRRSETVLQLNDASTISHEVEKKDNGLLRYAIVLKRRKDVPKLYCK